LPASSAFVVPIAEPQSLVLGELLGTASQNPIWCPGIHPIPVMLTGAPSVSPVVGVTLIEPAADAGEAPTTVPNATAAKTTAARNADAPAR